MMTKISKGKGALSKSSSARICRLKRLPCAPLAMRPCQNCTLINEKCFLASDSSKYNACTRRAIPCDLVVSDSAFDRVNNQMARLWEEIQKSMQMQDEAAARTRRLTKQLNVVRSKQQALVSQEMRNIDELKDDEKNVEGVATLANPISWDVESESFQLPDLDYSSLDFSLNMVAPVFDNAGSSQVSAGKTAGVSVDNSSDS